MKQSELAASCADRAAAPGFYAEAGYQPLAARGASGRNVIAFTRSDAMTETERPAGGRAAPRVASWCGTGTWSGEAFAGTCVPLPQGAAGATSSRAIASAGRRAPERLPSRTCAGRVGAGAPAR